MYEIELWISFHLCKPPPLPIFCISANESTIYLVFQARKLRVILDCFPSLVPPLSVCTSDLLNLPSTRCPKSVHFIHFRPYPLLPNYQTSSVVTILDLLSQACSTVTLYSQSDEGKLVKPGLSKDLL